MPVTDSSQFYTGLVARLYEPLAGDLADTQPIRQFVTRYGTPALELACGAGHPMLELLADGLEVHGIDSSQDMLDLCLEKAAGMDLNPTLACQPMQALSLPDRYACCYLAGASFCLMEDLEDARDTLAGVHKHLLPGGAFLVAFFRPEITRQPSGTKRKPADDGTTITVGSIAQSHDPAQQLVATTLRYTREQSGEVLDAVERVWQIRYYTVAQMTELLHAAGFTIHRCTDFEGSPVDDDATDFSVVALKT